MNTIPAKVILFLLFSMVPIFPLLAETPRTALTSEQIQAIPQSLQNWEVKDRHLERTIEFPSFLKLIEFVNKITTIAEAMNHHPDMDIRYKKLRLQLSTHDFDGVSTWDVELARKIDTALAQTAQ